MKISVIIVLALLCSQLANAQEPKGINFETGLSWVQIKQKARKENKYIFLDGYTTWCGPCKMMAKEIFPQPSVGTFFNKNFINVAVQFDITKKDNPGVKAWYKDAAAIKKKYKVDTYPTYLFFSPQGELVHSVYGASISADEFINKAKAALDPKLQYQSLTKQYKAGNRSPEFLLSILKSAMSNHDKIGVAQLSPLYFSTQKDLLSEENLKLLAVLTTKTTDAGFTVFRNHGALADLVVGSGQSALIINTIIFKELIFPFLRINGALTDYGAGMIVYSGAINPNVNWGELKTKLDSQYPDLSEGLLTSAKLTHLGWSKNWDELNKTILNILNTKKAGVSINQLNSIADQILVNSNDQKTLATAATWCAINMARAENPTEKLDATYMYASLIYKAGKKDEAIKELEQVLQASPTKLPAFEQLLEKMKNGA